jgi:hypothetical protein
MKAMVGSILTYSDAGTGRRTVCKVVHVSNIRLPEGLIQYSADVRPQKTVTEVQTMCEVTTPLPLDDPQKAPVPAKARICSTGLERWYAGQVGE